MGHPHHSKKPAVPKVPPSPYVEVTFVFKDTLRKPIEGLSVQIKAGTGASAAPAWKIGASDEDVSGDPAPVPGSATPNETTSADNTAVIPPVDSPTQMVDNETAPITTDKDGYALTIQNAARNQPIDVLVKNRRGEYVLKTTVTPKKDISAFTVVSPEYHLEATTKLSSKEAFEQNLDIPVLKDGEVMTIERLVNEFGPYIGWSQKVTEQGRVKKDFPTKKKEVTEDEKTHKKKTKILIEHHYKIVDTGAPLTTVLNVLGSRLNYPSPSIFTEEQYKKIALELNVEIAAIKAIIQQESQGRPFLQNGLPPILYERRHFFDLAVEKMGKVINQRKMGKRRKPRQTHILAIQICASRVKMIMVPAVCISMRNLFVLLHLILRFQ
ncbi:N-acetylmuramidase domain-containing protein [Paraburkholderia oxyphila]|uniref:N-acetylmuramidase domain-containing protein n=1 Tax=Paraburkholderia oxyphila TaxID=614212 RepID=UPI001FE02202|nr:N-acetylmuramidase domain-containing protein [Paraburkholderia oxyphila]